jgi:hypothetical protein
VLLQPNREPLVQVRADRLRQRVVGGVADQQMPKAKGVLVRKLRRIRPDQVPADERGEARRHLRSVRCQRADGAAMEDLSFDRPALEHGPLRRLELVEAGREQRLQRGRDDDLRLRVSSHVQDLRDEERVAAGGSCDPLAQIGPDVRGEQLVDGLRLQALEAEGDRPLGAALEQLRARHADEQDWSSRRKQRDVLD